MVKVTNIENDIKNYLSTYDERSGAAWGDFIAGIKAISKTIGFDPRQPLSDFLVFIFIRKMLDPDLEPLTSCNSISLKKYRIYILTLIRAFEVMGEMETPPIKSALKLIIVFLEVLAKFSLSNFYKKNLSDDKKSITEKRFEFLKNHLTPGLTDKEIKRKIGELTKLKDPKSQTKYLNMWRIWEKQLYESRK